MNPNPRDRLMLCVWSLTGNIRGYLPKIRPRLGSGLDKLKLMGPFERKVAPVPAKPRGHQLAP